MGPLARPGHAVSGAGRSGEVEQVGTLGLIEPQGPGHGFEDLFRDAVDVTLLQPRVPVGADTGEHGDLLAAQANDPTAATASGESDLLGGELGSAADEEVTDVGEHPELPFHDRPDHRLHRGRLNHRDCGIRMIPGPLRGSPARLAASKGQQESVINMMGPSAGRHRDP